MAISLLFFAPALFAVAFIAMPHGMTALLSLNTTPLSLFLIWLLGTEVVLFLWHFGRNDRFAPMSIAFLRGVALMAFLCVMALAAVQLQPRIPVWKYFLCLSTLMFRVTLDAKSRSALLGFLLAFITALIIGLMSYSIATGLTEWQTIVLFSGVAGITAAGVLASRHEEWSSDDLYERLLTFGIVLGPLGVSSLVFSSQFPRAYLISLVFVPLASEFATRTEKRPLLTQVGGVLIPFSFFALLCTIRSIIH